MFDHLVQFIYLSSFTRRTLDVGFLDSRLYKTIHTLKQLSRSRVTLLNERHLSRCTCSEITRFQTRPLFDQSSVSLYVSVSHFLLVFVPFPVFTRPFLYFVSSRPQLIFRSECISYFLSAAARSLLLRERDTLSMAIKRGRQKLNRVISFVLFLVFLFFFFSCVCFSFFSRDCLFDLPTPVSVYFLHFRYTPFSSLLAGFVLYHGVILFSISLSTGSIFSN